MVQTYRIIAEEFKLSDSTCANKWDITSEEKKIGEYNCRKATLEKDGRKWTAWFTTDLPPPRSSAHSCRTPRSSARSLRCRRRSMLDVQRTACRRTRKQALHQISRHILTRLTRKIPQDCAHVCPLRRQSSPVVRRDGHASGPLSREIPSLDRHPRPQHRQSHRTPIVHEVKTSDKT